MIDKSLKLDSKQYGEEKPETNMPPAIIVPMQVPDR